MPHAAPPPLPLQLEFCIVARRFNCIPARQRWLFFGILAGFSLGVGLAATAVGAWPVLPYSMLETGVLVAAFWYVERHAADWERLTVVEDRVVVERGCAGHSEKREFNRLWVRVELAEKGSAWRRRSRLELRFAGEAVVFGDALPHEERVRVARELRRLLCVR